MESMSLKFVFTITAEILAYPLAIFLLLFYCDASTSESGQFDNLYRKKQIDVSFSCVCPVIDNEFLHNIVKVACAS